MKFVGFDIETAGADNLFTYGDGFVRVGGYTTPDGPKVTADIEGELIPALNEAPFIYAHNFFGFDGLAMAHHYPKLVDWEDLAAKALDTMVLERLRFPPEARDVGGSKDRYDLDECCARHGMEGKSAHLPELAKLHGGYDQIPVTDQAYLDYLRQDVTAMQNLFEDLPRTQYAKREFEVESWLGRMTLNGFRVDIPLLNERLEQTEQRKQDAIYSLAQDYSLPLGRMGWKGRGKDKVEEWEPFASPLSSLEGRQWLLEVWHAFGIVNPPITDKGRLSTKAETLLELIETGILNPDLVDILEKVMTVTTTRTVYQTVQDYLVGDLVHPHINMGQASGRSSVTRPGLTVFGKRGERYHERDIFIGREGWSIFTCDLKQIDMRCVAALSEDPNYRALFEDGRDPHTEMAVRFFGSGSPEFRAAAKVIGHGANYGLGKVKLIEAGHRPDLVRRFFDERRTQFARLMEYTKEIQEIAREGYLDNGWGRKMKCDPRRLYTQPMALMGQGAAADALKECILRLPDYMRPHVHVTVHDEIVFSGPDHLIPDLMQEAQRAMTFALMNDHGKLIVVDHGTPGAVDIEADIEGPAKSWGGVIGAKK